MSNKWILRASEIDTFLTCPRKWGFRYLENIEAKASPAAQFGTNVHTLLEKFLKGNSIESDTDEGRVARPGLKFLPINLPHENIEKKIFFESGDHIFLGTPDFFENVGSQTWVLGDHKTCSSFSSALSPAQLKQNVQANIYSQWLIKEKNADLIHLKWIYYRTKSKPEARVVEVSLTKEEADNNFSNLLKTADQMVSLTKSNPRKLEKNTSACFKYGRCPYYVACKYAPAITSSNHQIVEKPDMPNQKPKTSFDLFIDCVPTKNDTTYEQTIELSELLKPVLSKIHTEKEISHYRLAGYGQHVGLIANYLSEHLRNNLYNHRTAILSSLKTPEGCDTLQTLTAAAGRVVRGF